MQRLLCLTLCLVSTVTLAAEVYRSVDANGVVTYSDRPEGETVERVHVATPAAGRPAPAASRSAEDAAAEEARQRELLGLGGEIRQQPSAEETAARRAENCTMARERAERYRVSHRLYRELPNGEREYLSDAELDEARAVAEADVATWCD